MAIVKKNPAKAADDFISGAPDASSAKVEVGRPKYVKKVRRYRSLLQSQCRFLRRLMRWPNG